MFYFEIVFVIEYILFLRGEEETRSYCVAQASLEITTLLSQLSAGITGLHHHVHPAHILI
jgi:hypothetical protein